MPRLGGGVPLLQSCREFARRQMIERAVRADRVVVDSPVFDDRYRFLHGKEAMLIQAFFTHSGIKRFHRRIFDWLTWRYEMQFNAASIGPCIQGIARKFRSIIHQDSARLPALFYRSIQNTNHATGRK